MTNRTTTGRIELLTGLTARDTDGSPVLPLVSDDDTPHRHTYIVQDTTVTADAETAIRTWDILTNREYLVTVKLTSKLGSSITGGWLYGVYILSRTTAGLTLTAIWEDEGTRNFDRRPQARINPSDNTQFQITARGNGADALEVNGTVEFVAYDGAVPGGPS